MKQKLLKIYFDLIMEWSKRKHANEQGRVRCCSCWDWSPWIGMLGGHFIPQSAGWIAKVMLNNVNAQHPQCNFNQHLEGRHGQQYMYGLWLNHKYGDGAADDIISKCRGVYSYNVDSISRDIDLLLGMMRDKLKTLEGRDKALALLEKRLGKKIYNILFTQNGNSSDLITYHKKGKK